MFYDPRVDPKPAPLTHNPFNALVAPRPIGWIATVDTQGRPNLAPFSYFNGLSADPPLIGFAPNALEAGPDGRFKDTLSNLREVPELTANVVSAHLARAMNETSRALPPGESEFDAAGLTAVPARWVRAPLVGEALACMECEVFDIIRLPAKPQGRVSHLVLAAVVGIHIDDHLIRDGRVDSLALAQVARLGYFDYSIVRETFELPRPE